MDILFCATIVKKIKYFLAELDPSDERLLEEELAPQADQKR